MLSTWLRFSINTYWREKLMCKRCDDKIKHDDRILVEEFLASLFGTLPNGTFHKGKRVDETTEWKSHSDAEKWDEDVNRKLILDDVNHPKHYKDHPSGIECIQITEHMGFNLGNAIKYIWRADLKEDAIKDLRKAIWYINRELKKRGAGD